MAGHRHDREALEAGRLELLGSLLPAALHELSNPLLALGGTVELLLDDAEPGTHSRARLELVHRTAQEIAELVRSLQQLARERLEPEQRIDLAAFARDTAAIAVRFSGVQDVDADVAVDELRNVDAEPAVLRQALLALTLDAIRAAERGGRVEIRVDAEGVTVSGGTGGGRPAAAAAGALGARLDVSPAGGAELRFVR